MTALFSFLYCASLLYCSCVPFPLDKSIEYSNSIFLGKVLAVREVEFVPSYMVKRRNQTSRGDYHSGLEIKFLVVKVFKGSVSDTITIMTGNGGGDCGFPFKSERSYVVYAKAKDYYVIDQFYKNGKHFKSHKETFLSTSICDRTTNNIESEDKLLDSIVLHRNIVN